MLPGSGFGKHARRLHRPWPMKTRDNIEREIESLLLQNYYGEDFEVDSLFRGYVEGLTVTERDLMQEVVARRLVMTGSIVDILLCGVLPVSGAGPILVNLLNAESRTSQVTRMLIQVLRQYPGEEAYRAVERFLDSDQEVEALPALAAMDFSRTLPSLVRNLRKPQFQGVLLHCLYDRCKASSLDQLIGELKDYGTACAVNFGSDLEAVLRSKEGRYNPWTPEQISALVRGVGA